MTRTLAGAREGSLLATIDLTVTPAGARLFAERLASPLTDPEAINERLDSLDFLVEANALREALRRLCRRARFPAFAVALEPRPRRPARCRGDPRRPRRGGRAGALAWEGRRPSAGTSRHYAALGADCGALERDLRSTLADDLPLVKRDGGFVRPGSTCLARREARRLRDESRRVIAEMQASYAEETGVRQLRIKHNHFLGHSIEVPQAQGEALLKPPFNAALIHRQTMAGALRFTTSALVDLEARIASAADKALALELETFERLRQACLAEGDRLRAFGAALAESTSPRRSRNSRSSATGRARWSTPRSPSKSSAAAIRWSRRR